MVNGEVQNPGIYNPDGSPVTGKEEGEVYVAKFNRREVPVIVIQRRLHPIAQLPEPERHQAMGVYSLLAGTYYGANRMHQPDRPINQQPQQLPRKPILW